MLHSGYLRASVFMEDERRTNSRHILGKTKEIRKHSLALWSPNS